LLLIVGVLSLLGPGLAAQDKMAESWEEIVNRFPGIPPRSATREQFLASAEKAGYLLEKEETFLIHDSIYVLRPKRRA